MSIQADSFTLEPGSRVRLLQIDMTLIDPEGSILNIHGHNYEGSIFWKGVEYVPWPFVIEGFEKTGDKPPTPTLTAGNVNQMLTALCLQFDDLVGATVVMKSTLVKYLDAVNFPGGNPTADPSEEFPDEIWFIDRKEHEDYRSIKWSLSSAMDFNGVQLPNRVIVANQCMWRYRSPECGYAGGPVAKYDDTPTSNAALDNCSRRVSGCKLRFGADAELPYGNFPASGLLRT